MLVITGAVVLVVVVEAAIVVNSAFGIEAVEELVGMVIVLVDVKGEVGEAVSAGLERKASAALAVSIVELEAAVVVSAEVSV